MQNNNTQNVPQNKNQDWHTREPNLDCSVGSLDYSCCATTAVTILIVKGFKYQNIV